uniref:PYM homolog 1, exon junction complex associated factor n=1 Tax=Cebus imitator TaxID=2715852 RepID=A0A2K5QLQ1_CEBIM
MVHSPFKAKMVACYDRDSTSGGAGGGTPARSRRKWFAFSRWRLPMLLTRPAGWEPPNLSLLFDFTLGYHQGQRMEPR